MSSRSMDQSASLRPLVPTEYKGWTIEEDRTFDSETIFDYIDGAGEVYRSYNMKFLFTRRFKAEKKPALIVDLFDMGDSEDAFGVFTHDLDGEDAGTGQGSTYKGGLLSFWKDRFFVSVYAEDETPETKEAVHALGGEIDRSIRATGEKPALLAAFPSEGLDEKTVRYFHNQSVLNYHFFVADENILRLDQKTAVGLASYGDGTRILIAAYQDATKAAAAVESFRKAYLPEAGGGDAVMTEDGKWTAARREETFAIVVFQAPSRASTEDRIRRVGERVR